VAKKLYLAPLNANGYFSNSQQLAYGFASHYADGLFSERER